MPLRERQIEIIKSFWDGSDDSKVIFQVPNWLLTSRHLTLPTKKQKQVAMMIPFQLEEKLPYSISESHYVSWIEKKKEHSRIAVSIVKKMIFKIITVFSKGRGTLPSILTSELLRSIVISRPTLWAVPLSFWIWGMKRSRHILFTMERLSPIRPLI